MMERQQIREKIIDKKKQNIGYVWQNENEKIKNNPQDSNFVGGDAQP